MRLAFSLLSTFLLLILAAQAQTWVPVADFPSGRHHPVTFSLNGKGYSVTGTSSSGLYTKTFYEYDPVLDAWTTLPDFPGEARGYAIGVVHNDLAYIGFGAGANNDLNDFWSYDAQNSQWTELASCPCTPRTHPALIALDNKIYMGLGSGTQNLNDFWEYDIQSNTWSQISNIPGPPRHHPYQFTAGGEVFAGLGHGNGIYKDWYKLDTTNNTWAVMANFPGEARVAGTQFDHAGYGYVLSGDGDDHSYMATGEMWQYDASIDSWTQLAPHPGVSRWAPGSFVIGNEVYFFGGVNKQAGSFPLAAYKYNLTPVSIGIQALNPENLKVYPNPFKDVLNVEMNNLSQLHYRIWSMDGKVLQKGSVLDGFVNTEDIGNGVFILEIQNSDGITISRNRVSKLSDL